jgi:hypothetical protein
MEAFSEGFPCGLTGTIGVTIDDGNGNNVVPRTTGSILQIECVGLEAVYRYLGVFPGDPALSPYVITWDDTVNIATEEILVSVAPSPSEAGGPCTDWIDGEDVAACCGVETSSGALFDSAAAEASALLYELSGRQYSGFCGPRTVRPECDSCFCGYQVLSRGYVIGPWDYGYPLMLCDSCLIACSPSRIKLAGYPVRAISEVKINGDVVSPTEYTIWNGRYLTRLNDQRWPVAQDLTVADTEDSTFSISYYYGSDPPALALSAAAQLGCELYRACADATSGDCALPAGTTRVTRQGVVIEKLAFTSWAFRDGSWRTGMPLVDAFLAAYNPAGIKRRPTFWSPGKRQYAQELG